MKRCTLNKMRIYGKGENWPNIGSSRSTSAIVYSLKQSKVTHFLLQDTFSQKKMQFLKQKIGLLSALVLNSDVSEEKKPFTMLKDI